MSIHHPWRALRDQQHLTLHWTRFDDGRIGATQDNQIWLDNRLLQVERRCAIAHELAHHQHGDTGCEDPHAEAKARRATAERLIDVAALIEACKWSDLPEEIADELWVTVDVLHDRIKNLSTVERALIDEAIRQARAHHHDT